MLNTPGPITTTNPTFVNPSNPPNPVLTNQTSPILNVRDVDDRYLNESLRLGEQARLLSVESQRLSNMHEKQLTDYAVRAGKTLEQARTEHTALNRNQRTLHGERDLRDWRDPRDQRNAIDARSPNDPRYPADQRNVADPRNVNGQLDQYPLDQRDAVDTRDAAGSRIDHRDQRDPVVTPTRLP